MNRTVSKPEGLASFILGIISIFYMAPVFVPLAIITGIVALFKRQFLWGVLGLICAFIGFMTSPILLAALGLAALGLGHSFYFSYPEQEIHREAPKPQGELIKIRYIQEPQSEETIWI